MEKNTNSRKMEYMGQWIQIQIYCYNRLQMFTFLSNLTYLFSQLQHLGMIAFPMVQFENTQLPSILQYICYVIRVDLWSLYSDNNIQQYAFLLVLACFILEKLLTLILILYRNRKFKQNIVNVFDNTKCWYIKLICNIIGIYSQLKIIVLFLPFTSIIIYSLKIMSRTINQEVQLYFLFFLAALTLLIVQIDILWNYIVLEEQFTLQSYGFQKFQINSYDFLSYFTSFFQIFFYGIIGQTESAIQIQIAVIILHVIINTSNELINNVIINKQHKQIFYLANAISFTSMVIYFFQQISNGDYEYILSMTVYVAPVIIYLLQSLDHNLRLTYFEKKVKQNDLLKTFIQEFNNQIQNIDESLIIAALQSLLHRKKCKMVNCFCRDDQVCFNVQQSFKITDQSYRSLLLKNVKIYKSLIQGGLQKDIFYLIQYSALLFRCGLIIHSVRQLNQLLFQKKDRQQSDQSNTTQIDKAYFTSSQTKKTNQSMQSSSISNQLAEYQSRQANKTKSITILNKQQLGLILKSKANYLLALCQSKTGNMFTSQIIKDSQQELSLNIQNYVQKESFYKTIQGKLVHIINKKIQFFIFLMGDQLNNDALLQKTKQVISTIRKMQNVLLHSYKAQPSSKIQSALSFYCSEIMNDWSLAQTYSRQNKLDNNILVYENVNAVNSITDNMTYLLLSLSDDLLNLEISFLSQSFLQRYGLIQNLKQILPQYIENEHSLLLNKFITTGISSFYRKFNQNFIFNPLSGFCEVIDICFDNTEFYSLSKLSFATFIQQQPQNQAFILVDVNLIVGGFTKGVFNKLGVSDDLMSTMIQIHNGQSLQINNIFPEFIELINGKQDCVRAETTIQYLNDSTLQDIESYINHDSKISNQLENLFSQQSILRRYDASIIIQRRQIYEHHYYIIQIEDIVKNFVKSLNQTINSSHKYSFNIKELTISEVEDIHPAQPKATQLKLQSFKGHKNIIQDIKMDQNFIEELQVRNYPRLVIQPLPLLSPNQSASLIHPDGVESHFFIQQQQEYYNNPELKEESESKQIDKSNLKEIIEQQLFIDDSSKTGVNKSVYWFKYQLFKKFISEKTPIPLNVSFGFLMCQYLMFIVFALIVLTVCQTDINLFYKEIDMLTLQSGLMGPHDTFLSLRVIISSYQQLNTQGFISTALLSQLTDPIYYFVALGYKELEQNFYTQLQNKNLQDFFIGQTLDTTFMGVNSSVVYTINLPFREAMKLEIETQYKYLVTFLNRGAQSNTPYQVYQYGNYFDFQNRLKVLTSQIQKSTINEASNVSDKWLNIWIAFTAIAFVLIIICQYFYAIYMSYYDQILSIYKYLDKNQIIVEIDKNKQLLKLLEQKPDLIFNYNFNLALSESKIIKAKPSVSTQIKQLTKFQKQSESVSRLKYFILICISFAAYMAFSLSQNRTTISFLSKYAATTEIFNLIQDCQFRSANVFLYREIFFRWSNFTYLTSLDIASNYQLISLSLNASQSYINIMPQLDPSKYLMSDSFFQYQKTLQTANLTQYIDESYAKYLSPYCAIGLQGTLVQGMIPALTYIINAIQTEQAINNFTSRTEYELYQIEGAQVLSRIFIQLSTQFKAGMLSRAEDQNTLNNGLAAGLLCFILLFGYFLLSYVRPYLQKEYLLLKGLIHLVPIELVLTNDSFERALRLIMLNQNI